MRKTLVIVASIVVSAVFLWLALRDVPLDQVFAAIGSANGGWIALSFASVTLALFLRGVRWKVLLGDRLTLMQCAHIFNVGMFVNLLPLRAGEVVRVIVAARCGVPVLTAGASIIVERLLDVVMVVIVLAIGLSRAPFIPAEIGRTAIVFSGVAVVGFAAVVVFARFPALAHRVAAWPEARIPALHRLHLAQRVEETLAGLSALTHLRVAAGAIFWTLIGWVISLGTFVMLLLAFDVPRIAPDVDLLGLGCLGLSLASLGVALPVTVAGIGPFQGGARVAGDLMGLDAVISAGVGILFHGVTVINYAMWGVIGLVALGVSFGDLMKAQCGTEETASAAP